ncbi:hypothetical protein A2U01_0088284, partial [Trifolium medium]|nr:hypothetical protein [Trifolium medium]
RVAQTCLRVAQQPEKKWKRIARGAAGAARGTTGAARGTGIREESCAWRSRAARGA